MHQHAITSEAVLKLVTKDFDRRQLAIKAPSQDEAFVLKPERGKARSANARSNVTTTTSGAM